ncbi:MAG: 3-keto-disaccharide hydrolase [Luteolibacter sp.]
MKKLLLLPFLFFAAHTVRAADPTEDYGWVNLLENDSLELWQNGSGGSRERHPGVGPQWSLKDGVLKLDKSAEGRGGHIITKEHDYFNFELKFEFIIAKGGNSGIKYRVNDESVGLEYQVYDDEGNESNKTACLYALKHPSDNKKVFPAGTEWNTGRILAVGNTLQHWVNGELVMEIVFGSEEWNKTFGKSKYKDVKDFAANPGPIHIQDHGSNVQYRNMMIRKVMDTE